MQFGSTPDKKFFAGQGEDRMFAEGARTRYLLYRCYKCNRLITALQMEARWAKAEEDQKDIAPKDRVNHPGICVCGSRHYSPTNATTWEELTTPAIWVLWWKRVRGQ
jgi:hypothetical protein